jgi:hydroxymethylpyrimidine pyrophosphatase-like HAD family hydrolase
MSVNPTPELNKAIAKAKLEFPKILANRNVKITAKTGRVIQFTYAELEEILEAITPVLCTNGLVLASQIQYLPTGQLILCSSIRHDSGEYIESHFPLPASYGDTKELGIQISYGRRYNCQCLLEICTIEPSDTTAVVEQQRKFGRDLRKEIQQIPENPSQNFQNIQSAPINREMLYKEIDSVVKRKGFTHSILKEIAFEKFRVKNRSELTDQQLQEFLQLLQLKPNLSAAQNAL